jgi:hypothetical protein
MAGVPNTLPLQDLNRDAELGRVGYSPHPEQGNAATRSSTHRTKFYNMLETTGQTDRNNVEWLNFQNSATPKIVWRRATRPSAFSPDRLVNAKRSCHDFRSRPNHASPNTSGTSDSSGSVSTRGHRPDFDPCPSQILQLLEIRLHPHEMAFDISRIRKRKRLSSEHSAEALASPTFIASGSVSGV